MVANKVIMTPKQKAIEVVDEIQHSVIEINNQLYTGFHKEAAKNAAQIVIGNILRTDKDFDTIPFSIFWGSVINEIEKL
jgi:hypothetical protein